MANQPSTKKNFNVSNISGVTGEITVNFESNSNNTSVGRVTSVLVDGKEIDPSSSQATTILSDSNTISAFRTSLKEANSDYYTKVGNTVTPSYVDNASQLYQSTLDSEKTKGSIDTSTGIAPTTSTQKSTFKQKVLAYPVDLLDVVQDFFQITAIKYEAPNANTLSIKDGTETGIGILKEGLGSKYSTIKQSELQDYRKKNELGTVILPMPGQVQDVNGSNWGDTFLNPLTAAAIGGAVNAAQGVTNPSGLPGGVVEQFQKLQGAVGNEDFQSYIANIAKIKAVQKVTGLSTDENELLARVTGSITNPNAELLYKGPRLRQFSFTYQFTPRSPEEAKDVRRIIRFFKENMSAEKSTFLLSTPNVFFLEYRRKGRDKSASFKSLNKFKPCALVSFNVDNSAKGSFWNSYYDEDDLFDESQPITTGIQMQFQEIVPIFRDNYIDEGFDDDDVGY